MSEPPRELIDGKKSSFGQDQDFRILSENSPAGIFHSNTQGKITYINPTLGRLISLPAHLALGDGWMKHLHPHDRASVKRAWKQSIKNRSAFLMEFRFISPEERITWVLCEAVPQKASNHQQKIIDFVGVMTDITSYKLNEEALNETENQFRYIVKHSPFSIAVFDNNLCYLAVSDRYLRDFYYEVKDVIGKNHYAVTPNIPQRWRDFHVRCLQGAVESAEEDIYIHKDGSIDYINWECRPWFSSDGSVGGIVLFTEIVTHRKLAEDLLRQSEERYRKLIETSPDAIVHFDLHGNFLTINKQMALILGYDSVDEMMEAGLKARDLYTC
ncbi:MAG: PAS domain S-box protein [Anaerolineaceae bacterium]